MTAYEDSVSGRQCERSITDVYHVPKHARGWLQCDSDSLLTSPVHRQTENDTHTQKKKGKKCPQG